MMTVFALHSFQTRYFSAKRTLQELCPSSRNKQPEKGRWIFLKIDNGKTNKILSVQ